MGRIVWDSRTDLSYGLDRGVLYPSAGPGVAWNGLKRVVEAPAGSEERARYLDGVKTNTRRTRGEFSGSVEALTYPAELYDNVLVQKRAQAFGMSYRITAGDHYQLHLVYNVVLVPKDRVYRQRNTDAFMWDFSTLPVDIPIGDRSAHLILDTSLAYSWVVQDLEDILYGSLTTDPRLPTPQEVWDLVEAGSLLIVTDHGDGTFTITGSDAAITSSSPTTFEVTWPSVIIIDADTYQVSSL